MATVALIIVHMKKTFIIIIFYSINILCFAQYNDIRINFAPVYHFSGKTYTDYKDSLETYYSQKLTKYEVGIGYTRFFKNDYYAKISYGIRYYSNSQPEIREMSPSLWEISVVYKYPNHRIYFDGGKILSYKFIDFLVGVGLNYEYSPPSTMTTKYDEYAISDHSFLSAQYNKYEYPSSHYLYLYLNTSLYFRFYKLLSFGIELNNGFSYAFGKGRIKYTLDFYDSNHTLYKQEIQEDDANIKIFSSELLDLKFGLRVVIPDIKKKVK